MGSDCTVPIDDGLLNIRVGAIICRGNEFLMMENDKDPFLYSVGGRVKFGETAQEAIVREVLEETGTQMEIDMSGMMDGNIIYTESYRNAVLSSWLDVNTATMPPVYTMSNQVFLIRLKDNTYAAIRFTNYMNARGIKGYIDFNFQYPLEFEDNNNETNQQE